MKNYVLVGFMGSGKTTIGHSLADALGLQHVDLDERIVQEAGMPVTEIFRKEGEQGFRRRETALLEKLIEGGGEGFVYSAGGGIVIEKVNRQLLHRLGTVILLDVSSREVIRRIGKDQSRPLLQAPDREKRVMELMAARRSAYEESSDFAVRVDGRTPEDITEEICRRTAG